MNKFEKAIKQHELLEFALGNREYYLRDRDYDEHWFLGSWINYILPYCRANNCDAPIREMFQVLIKDSALPQQEKLDALLCHIYVFYYLIGEKRLDDKNLIIELENAIGVEIDIVKDDIIAKGSLDKLNEMRTTVALIKSRGGLNNYNFE